SAKCCGTGLQDLPSRHGALPMRGHGRSPSSGYSRKPYLRLAPARGVKQLVDTGDRDQRNARTLDAGKVVLVFRKIRALGGLLRWNALLLQSADLGPDVAQIRLEVADFGLVGERLAMTWQNGLEVELLQLVQRRDPLVHEGITHVRERSGKKVA